MTTASAAALASAGTQAAHAASSNANLLAGVASRDVTPDPGVPMWGYSNRKDPATGTLDPLFAKVLVLRSTSLTVALAVIDFGRTPIESVCARITAAAKEKGVDHVIYMATHTHGGPVMESGDAPHIKRIEQGIIDAITEAVAALQPATIATGKAAIDIAHNRRIIRDGKCYMLWRNAERKPTSPVDKEATLIQIHDANRKPMATLVHYACHPVVLGPDNLQYSADWSGEMCRIVKEKTGAECFFLQGGAGDINPYLDKTPLNEGGLESMRTTGKQAADALLAALPEIAPTASTGSLDYAEKLIRIGTRWDFSNPTQQQIFRSVYGAVFDKYLATLTPDLAVPLAVLVINKELALACMPGELFVQYQLDLKANSLLPNSLLCGYANGFHLYFPTLHGAAAGGYGGIVATYVGNGAGDRLLAEALIEIGNASGRIKNVLEVSDFELKEA